MSSQPIYGNELPEDERSQVVRRSTRRDDDIAGDELPQYDYGTLSDFVRKPTRTAADLDQCADLEDDLDAVLADERAPTDREMIKEILERVRRIEESSNRAILKFRHLGDWLEITWPEWCPLADCGAQSLTCA
jgi:hypothetical protein